MAASLHTAFPNAIQELHIPVNDTPDDNLMDWFDKICEFIGENTLTMYQCTYIRTSESAYSLYKIELYSISFHFGK